MGRRPTSSVGGTSYECLPHICLKRVRNEWLFLVTRDQGGLVGQRGSHLVQPDRWRNRVVGSGHWSGRLYQVSHGTI